MFLVLFPTLYIVILVKNCEFYTDCKLYLTVLPLTVDFIVNLSQVLLIKTRMVQLPGAGKVTGHMDVTELPY